MDSSSSSQKVVHIFQGISGIGKSFTGEKLTEKLNSLGEASKHIEQDHFVLKNGKANKNSSRDCLNKYEEYLKEGDLHHIIQTRNNFKEGDYEKYVKPAKSNGWKVNFVVPKDYEQNKYRYLVVALCSVFGRKMNGRKGEEMSHRKKFSIVFDFFKLLVIADGANEYVDYMTPISYLKDVCNDGSGHFEKRDLSEEQTDYLNELCDRVEPFVCKDHAITQEVADKIIEDFKFGILDYTEWRNPVDSIVDDLINQFENENILKKRVYLLAY
ncbi:hypothetical protein MHBO_001772 [Bonamia ostreae]|uniref:Uncharacterized protein n=1 Tax=Bonamia ostreae TaxID=126728 RepID=A0ABV2AK41_9EUKA